jgi:hypothetical protein
MASRTLSTSTDQITGRLRQGMAEGRWQGNLQGRKNEVLGASLLFGGTKPAVSASLHGPCLILPATKLNDGDVSITLKLECV